MEVSRGDLVIGVFAGNYGKPRPALVIQDNSFRIDSLTLLPLTSDLRHSPTMRIDVAPSSENGLREASQIMIDKVATVTVQKIRQRIGRVDAATVRAVERALARFLGLE